MMNRANTLPPEKNKAQTPLLVYDLFTNEAQSCWGGESR
jgi:hypothetical protein